MLYLHGLGHFHPSNVIDNDFLASLDIGVDCNWIEERVGIRERRTTMSLEYIRETRNLDTRASAEASATSTVDMAREAALCALRRAGLEAKSIKMVIAGGCCPEMLIPAEACRVAGAMEMPALAFDVSAACASFAAQIHFIAQMQPETLPDFILVLNVEAFTRTIDYSDRKSAVLFGDGATAAILSPRVPSPRRIVASTFQTDPAGHHQITIPAGGHFAQEGHRVQLFAIRRTAEMVEYFRSHKNGDAATDEYFVGHQANLRVLEGVCGRLKIEESRHLSNVAKFGNCGAAGAPSVLSQNWDSLGDCAVNLAVVGSGLSWGGVRIQMTGANSTGH
ncbi:MAG TPA: ketoacyl-ACP synthase III [Candidatus Acidoferrum sp.]|nr:ketoacyl-ACP synthase III [Candidatus Acidoferrum sp.]